MKVRITFDRPEALVMDLNAEQMEALEDDYSWEHFIQSIETELTTHLFGAIVLDDVRTL